MPDRPSEEPHETEEELEERLKRLLGEGQFADSEEAAEIELKLRDIDDRFEAQREARKKDDATMESEFEGRLRNLHARADNAKERLVESEREKQRRYAAERDSAKGLGIGLTVAYTIIGLPLAGVGVGWLIDRGLGTTSGKGIGVLIGAALGMVMALIILKRSNERQ